MIRLTTEQRMALHTLAVRNYDKIAKEILGDSCNKEEFNSEFLYSWQAHDEKCGFICLVCGCKMGFSMDEEHGILHFKEHNLLSFI